MTTDDGTTGDNTGEPDPQDPNQEQTTDGTDTEEGTPGE